MHCLEKPGRYSNVKFNDNFRWFCIRGVCNNIKSLNKPLHTDGLSTAQFLFPCLIELCDDFLGFLLVMEKQPALKMEVLPLLILIFINSLPTKCLSPSPPFIPTHTTQIHFFYLCIVIPFFSYLEPFNGFLTGRAKDAIVDVADGAGSTG